MIEDITSHFHDELGQELKLFAGGVERENLVFEVQPVSAAERYERTFQILTESLAADGSGSAIVYAETREGTEKIRDFLQNQGMGAEAFHGGLDAKEKRDIIDSFVAGRTPVICATNAFGMGIDKANVRLVLHFEMPGSLENYIQEAGRAGRDGEPARCVLLYDPDDANLQFRKGAMSEVKQARDRAHPPRSAADQAQQVRRDRHHQRRAVARRRPGRPARRQEGGAGHQGQNRDRVA